MDIEDFAASIMQLLGVETMADAHSKVTTLVAHKPLVVMDKEGRLLVAPMTVRQILQLMTALEGLTVQ